MPSPQKMHELHPFGLVNSSDLLNILVSIRREDGGVFRLSFKISGAQKVLFPQLETHPRRCHQLWEHTCFEAFISEEGHKAYWECNFSPSGNWNIYHFDGYRQGMREETGIGSVPIELRKLNDGEFLLNAAVSIPGLDVTKKVEVALTSVIELQDHQKSYWALAHVSEKPDFHQRGSFQLTM